MNIEKMKQSQFKCKKRAQLKQYEKLKQKYSNESLQTIRISNRKLNCLRWGSNETKEHILKKLDICIELKEINHNFITEAIFINGSRADVIDLTEGIIYEILVSEREENFKEKIKKYPRIFTIIKIK
jgi:hypothetical protein